MVNTISGEEHFFAVPSVPRRPWGIVGLACSILPVAGLGSIIVGAKGDHRGTLVLARRATINGAAAAAWAPNGKIRVAFSFTVRDGRIVDIELIADRKRLGRLDIAFLDD